MTNSPSYTVDGYPENFSFITTVRAKPGTSGFLFTIYDGVLAREVMGLEIGDRSTFLYEDHEGRPGFEHSPKFSVNMADGRYVGLYSYVHVCIYVLYNYATVHD